MEASLHLSEPQPGVLLVPSDPLQLFLAVLLSDAGALLPLLDALREDLVDATVDESSQWFKKQFAPKLCVHTRTELTKIWSGFANS